MILVKICLVQISIAGQASPNSNSKTNFAGFFLKAVLPNVWPSALVSVSGHSLLRTSFKFVGLAEIISMNLISNLMVLRKAGGHDCSESVLWGAKNF
jgi:hypothetical protein